MNSYSAGGVLDAVTNRPMATFTIQGASFGAGLRPTCAVAGMRDQPGGVAQVVRG